LKYFNGIISRNGGRSLVSYLIKFYGSLESPLNRSKVKMICIFSFHCYSIFKHEGFKGLVLHLKTSHVLIQQAVAGYKIKDQNPLKRRVTRSRSGLPKWLPITERRLLIKQDLATVRFWTSLISIYRIIDYPGSPDLSSITDPGLLDFWSLPAREVYLLETSIKRWWDRLDLEVWINRWLNVTFTFFPIGRSSPQTNPSLWSQYSDESSDISSSYWSIWSSSLVWSSDRYSKLRYHLDGFLDGLVNKDFFLTGLKNVYRTNPLDHLNPKLLDKDNNRLYPGKYINYYLGKLGFKPESAGKIRVFAMVDIWTQWLLFPLNRLLQDVIRPIKEDATFDQIGKLESKISNVKSKGIAVAYSYDLSSATDRLPVILQVWILKPLMGLKTAVHWASLLTHREYQISPSASKKYDLPLKVTYSVGQPMGALSSWIMLAVTHHIIVQWASLSARKSWSRGWYFEDYIILGDDIVIFNSYVANRYYYIMTELLGVKIGLAKSIVSTNGLNLEFAKKYYCNGRSCNLIPLRDWITTSISTSTMIEFMNKHKLDLQSYLRARGFGYKARSKIHGRLWHMGSRLRVHMVLYLSTQKDWLDWITMRTSSTNYPLNRYSFYLLISFLFERRKRIIRAWNSAIEHQSIEFDLMRWHPYFLRNLTTKSKVFANKFGLPYGRHYSMEKELKFYFKVDNLDKLSVLDLKSFAILMYNTNQLLKDNSVTKNRLSWFTSGRTEEKFTNFISTYRDWVHCNSFFLPTSKLRHFNQAWEDARSKPMTKSLVLYKSLETDLILYPLDFIIVPNEEVKKLKSASSYLIDFFGKLCRFLILFLILIICLILILSIIIYLNSDILVFNDVPVSDYPFEVWSEEEIINLGLIITVGLLSLVSLIGIYSGWGPPPDAAALHADMLDRYYLLEMIAQQREIIQNYHQAIQAIQL